MPRPELAIVGLVYVAALVLGQRGVAMIAPTAQEIGFAVAAVAGGVTAAILHQRRARDRAPTSAKLAVGLLMALLAASVGFTTYTLWSSTLRPQLWLPIAAVATFLAPWIIFPILRPFRAERSLTAAPPVGELHVAATAVAAAVVLVVAYFIPVPGRSNVRLVGKSYPGLFIGLPEWVAEQDFASMEVGSIKLRDPRSAAGDRFLAVRWIDADPVQPDEHVQTIALGGLSVRDRSVALVGKHQATTFYLESDDHRDRAAATVWNCPQDHRVLWVVSRLAGPRSSMLATHEKILHNVRCHTGRNKEVAAAAATHRVYPSFAPPGGFTRATDASKATAAGLVYVGPEGEEIVFDAALPGRSDAVNENVSPDIIARLLTHWGILARVEGAPTLTTVTDMRGHTRRVWSVAGETSTSSSSSRTSVQMELMIWYCDKRNMTFIGRYATEGAHDAREGIDALLPSACHVGEENVKTQAPGSK